MTYLAQDYLRNKRDELERVFKCNLTSHQHFLLSDLLIQFDFLDERIAIAECKIEAKLEYMPPFHEEIHLLDTIQGVNLMTTGTIVSEIGVDMYLIPYDRHLTSLAVIAKGNNVTCGKQRSGQTRRGNKYLSRILVIAAHGAAHTKNTNLKSLYYRLKSRRGGGKAVMAIERTILQITYYMIQCHETYNEMGGDYFDQFDKVRTSRRLIKHLEMLSFIVQVTERSEL